MSFFKMIKTEIDVLLTTVRTIGQGKSADSDKESKEYFDEAAIVLLHTEDMKKLSVENNTPVKIRTRFGEVIVKAKESEETKEGIALIPVGFWANMTTGNSVQSNGIPLLKNIPATIESTEESLSDIQQLTSS
ncbi:MAG: molybdopterin dinucleotide binding domain-containing protein [Candidatus Sifarchaeia archaeon]